ncbi:GtrA family protein [Paenibacillus sp.]|uniref:GtrA family protein n=1 Tax=Paenibacillus sp. TaxID=58172 RepID=UPI002811F496|nr:GtrA family protein [Paenibacillus sp.]
MKTFARFLAVGVLNTVVGYGTTFAALALGAPYLAATALGTALGLAVSFAMNRRFTFRHRGSPAAAALRFGGASLACYLSAFPAARAALADWAAAPLSPDQTAAVAGSVIYSLLHYAALRFVVFNPAKSSHESL